MANVKRDTLMCPDWAKAWTIGATAYMRVSAAQRPWKLPTRGGLYWGVSTGKQEGLVGSPTQSPQPYRTSASPTTMRQSHQHQHREVDGLQLGNTVYIYYTLLNQARRAEGHTHTYVYIYMYTHTYMHIHTHKLIYICIQTCTYTNKHNHLHTQMSTFVHIRIFAFI